MPSMIVDGRARFGISLAAFYRQERLVLSLARRRILIPPIKDIATDAEPALAYVNPLGDGSVRWIANCPACLRQRRTAAEYVWLETPLFFCVRCGNADIGSQWRPVLVPADSKEIERVLLERSDPLTRGWLPGETVADLRAQNAELARKGGD